MPVVRFGGKVVPSYGAVPGGISPVVVLHDLGGVFDEFAAQEVLVVIEVHPHELGRVEQPVVVIRQAVCILTGQVSSDFTDGVGVTRAEDTKATVVGERHRDHPDARKDASFFGGLPDHGQPVLEPTHVHLLTRDELTQRCGLVRGLVRVARLQPEGCVLEGAEELTELRAGFDHPTQRWPSSFRLRSAYILSTSSGISISVSWSGRSPTSASAWGSVTFHPCAMYVTRSVRSVANRVGD